LTQRNNPQPSLNSKPDSEEQTVGYDPQDILTTPNGPAVMLNGEVVHLQHLDPSLVAGGWPSEPDVDFELTPEGGYGTRGD
jgi:hypothetical protein